MTRVQKCAMSAGVVLALGATSFVQASNYSAAVQALSPLDYWQFAGPTTSGSTSIDQGSNATGDGTYGTGVAAGAGIPTATFPGFTGGNQSLSFAGAGQITGSDANEVAGSGARTVIAWVNTTTADSSYHDIFYYGTSGYSKSIFTLIPPSNTDTGFPAGTSFGVSTYNPDASSTAKVNDGSWHMVAFTMTPNSLTNTSITFYVDGVAAGSTNIDTNTVLGSTYYIGNDALNDPYNGQLAQEAVFNTALGSSDISGLYHAAVTPEPASLSLIALGGLGLLARRRRA